MTGVMSTPMPSPSMNGTIGLSGTGCPVTSFAPPSGTWISVVVLIRESYRHRMEIARRSSDLLLDGFNRHYTLFRATSARAKEAFDAGDWAGVQRLVKERIRFYDQRVLEYVARLRDELAKEALDDAVWQQAKLLYVGLLIDHKRPELAETFFNSVTTRVLGRTYVHDDLIFLRAAVSTEYIPSDPPTYRSYYPAEPGLRATFLQVFGDFGWTRRFADLEGDIDHVVPVLHDEEGRLVLDTILLEQQRIDVLFSLSRAYFLVDMDVPSAYVHSLQRSEEHTSELQS